jgi:hypothetical protein
MAPPPDSQHRKKYCKAVQLIMTGTLIDSYRRPRLDSDTTMVEARTISKTVFGQVFGCF